MTTTPNFIKVSAFRMLDLNKISSANYFPPMPAHDADAKGTNSKLELVCDGRVVNLYGADADAVYEILASLAQPPQYL